MHHVENKSLTSTSGIQYYPYLLDIVAQGKYDPSFMFTHTGWCPVWILANEEIELTVPIDDFENIGADYAKFHEHTLPGGLKVCLQTAFGRSLEA